MSVDDLIILKERKKDGQTERTVIILNRQKVGQTVRDIISYPFMSLWVLPLLLQKF